MNSFLQVIKNLHHFIVLNPEDILVENNNLSDDLLIIEAQF